MSYKLQAKTFQSKWQMIKWSNIKKDICSGLLQVRQDILHLLVQRVWAVTVGRGPEDPPGTGSYSSQFIFDNSTLPGEAAPQHLTGPHHVHGWAPELGHIMQVSVSMGEYSSGKSTRKACFWHFFVPKKPCYLTQITQKSLKCDPPP